MRAILKWSIPVFVVAALAWGASSIGKRMPINQYARIDTPAGPIEFRLVVIPGDDAVRLSLPPLWQFHGVRLADGETDRLFSGFYAGDLNVTLPAGAELSMRRGDDGSWSGFWTAPPGTRTAPYLPVTFFGREPREASNDPAAVPPYRGRWRVRAADGTSALLELHASRDASGLVGVCSTFTGELELGGHADADGLRLTCFDGERAIAARGRINDDGTIAGDWWDSQRGLLTWTAVRDD